MKIAEDYFKERHNTENWDKHDKKVQRYNFYDMVDFAEQFASQDRWISVEKHGLPSEEGSFYVFTRKYQEVAYFHKDGEYGGEFTALDNDGWEFIVYVTHYIKRYDDPIASST